MKLTEPVTAITDYILAAELLVFSIMLWRNANDYYSVRLWSVSFVALCIGAFAGGTFHGFQESLKAQTLDQIWKGTLLFILLSLGMMVAGGIFSAFSGFSRIVFLLADAAIILLALKQGGELNFPLLMKIVAAVFLLLMVVLLYQVLFHGSATGKWILAGSLITLVGIVVQLSGFRFHEHFNQNDLFHVIMMVAVYFLYRGGLLLRDRG
ncbi:MAG TPA: hypothetical protein VJ521_10820 [Acidobacteriota bacterium]|nr:hypothetical protein [Acidobacteriota bacterium]